MNTKLPNSEFFTEGGKAVAERLYVKAWGRTGLGIERLCNELAELRAKVEALEEAENNRKFERAKALIDQSAPTPTSSLVERLEAAGFGRTHARAAIREVAAWLRDRNGYPWAWVAQMLELEADR